MKEEMKERRTISIDRQVLYDEIWENSLHKTAVKYNVSDARLKEACIAAEIPLPTLSYWGKKNMEMDVSAEVVPLPESKQTMVVVVQKTEGKAANSVGEKKTKKEPVSRKSSPKIDSHIKPVKPAKGITVVSRQEIYDTIWKLQNMSKTAKQYDIPVTRLTTICEVSNIPLPTPTQMGDRYHRWRMEKVPLPQSEQTEVRLYTKKAYYKGWQKEYEEYILQTAELNHIKREKPQLTARQILVKSREGGDEEKKSKEELLDLLLNSPTLCSMDKDMRGNVFRQVISLSEKKSGKLHHDVVSYRQSVEKWEMTTGYEARNNVPANIRGIAKNSRKRMYGIMDLLVQGISPFGGSMKDGAILIIGKDQIGIEFVEGTDKVPHVLTKEEAKQLAEYNDAKRWKRYASMPNIKKYDNQYNGLLRIRIGNTYYGEGDRISIADSKEGLRLEDRIDEMLIAVFEKMEAHRIRREAEEEKERKREEEKRRAEERKQRISEEKDKTRELVSCARRCRIAMEIRNYVSAMREAESAEYSSEWAEWALKKADWYDPVISREDELLGDYFDLEKQEQKPKSFWDGFYQNGLY